MRYEITRVPSDQFTEDWADKFWQDIPTESLTNHMGDRPVHFPLTHFRVGYDERNLFVIFKVNDQYIRAAAEKHQDSVCRDSCVEFFFTPHDDPSQGYFNLEMNCGGTMLLNFQQGRSVNVVAVADEALAQMTVKHSLPNRIETEIAEPRTWTVAYRLPIAILARYSRVEQPRPGVVWHGNFYKCADETSHPHWLTWAPIDKPKPDFHRPDFFAELLFV